MKINIAFITQDFGSHLRKPLTDLFLDTGTTYHLEHICNCAVGNCIVLDLWNNWAIPQYLKSYQIRMRSVLINFSLQASKKFKILSESC